MAGVSKVVATNGVGGGIAKFGQERESHDAWLVPLFPPSAAVCR